MSLKAYYDSFASSAWAHPEAEKCACRGRGYALSEVDTWHECPEHFVPGQPHPEEYDGSWDWDQEAELKKYKAGGQKEGSFEPFSDYPAFDVFEDSDIPF